MSMLDDWTDSEITKLKGHFVAGLPYSVIANDLGRTRAAVCGKLYRMGLTRGKKAAKGRNRYLSAPTGRAPQTLRVTGDSYEMPTDNVVDLPPDKSDCAVPFMRLDAHTCRWPIADALFCGAEPYPDRPYCGRHCAIAYRRPGEQAA